MFAKSTKKKFNFWGEDSHEKITDTQNPNPSILKNLTDIVNPVSLVDQIFGAKAESKKVNSPEKISSHRKQETVVFSLKASHEDRKLQEETQSILNILKKQIDLLEKSEKALSKEISRVKVEQLPSKSGIYHLRFFEWLLVVIRGLRVKIDEGRTWLATFNQKKEKKNGYWKRYKKHGTNFGMSNERTLATQTG